MGMPPSVMKRVVRTAFGFVIFSALGREFYKPLNESDRSLNAASFIRRPFLFDEVDKSDADDKDIARQVVQEIDEDANRKSIVDPTSIKPVEQIIVLGERHSGTDELTSYLAECFDIKVTDTYKRYKHWFQEEDLMRVPENSAVVVAIFRDPFDWVQAMRVEPLHAHDHLRWYRRPNNYDRRHIDPKIPWTKLARPLGWKDFVTRPWIGQRGSMDKNISRTNRGMTNAECLDHYTYYDVSPCSVNDTSIIKGLSDYKYELKNDKSERGYSSIIDLRREKILNHLSVAEFLGVRSFLPFRFEDLHANGMISLIQNLEEAIGIKAKCDITTLERISRHVSEIDVEFSEDYIRWMDAFVDWEVESLVGYSKRGKDAHRGNIKEDDQVADHDEDTATQALAVATSLPMEPVQQIILLGERHGGTNWITDHLAECFDIKVSNTYKRYKHWFQEEDLTKVPENSAVVVAMFRDPYDWVEAMRVEPHHAHDHLRWYRPHTDQKQKWKDLTRPLEWKEFVTRPWIGKRGSMDKNISVTPGGIAYAECLDHYTYYDVSPCSVSDAPFLRGLGEYKYELKTDKSERGYSSIIDLRREKILNHLSVAEFNGVRSFLPFRFEDLNANGTSVLIQNVEKATGLVAKCNATLGKAPHRQRFLVEKQIRIHRELPSDFIKWMNRFVDWEVEGRLGYSRRG